MGFFDDIFGGGNDYEFAPTQWLTAPEYSEAEGARGDWASKLKQWGQEPGYGAIAPDWGDIWNTAQKRIKQYYWGGAGGQTGLADKVKASAARRGVSDSPALESQLTNMGYEEGGKQSELASNMAFQEAQFGEQGRQNWMQWLMNLAGQKPNSTLQTADVEQPSGASGLLGNIAGMLPWGDWIGNLFGGGIESGGGIDIGGGRTTYGPNNVPLGFPK
jgi:hypothetical protein